ncbi:allene oxide synthase-lipoxygenase protein [Octopus sinensis]|uniref:Allene oxide synthase-lipoxygenase protein n=1 Tax=Octopus sinensis TaxID=2607531 RepID=A0A6P7TP06_9MOLL|nr:allene oxide synthase-lipoxygenase protein [Octopus sinensis]XP_036354404.1 allene oxide synthase-lipoxygenase protein [Octopus sinensis]
MGLQQSRLNNALQIRTGDQRESSTDSNVYVILHDTSETKSEMILLDNWCRNDFKIGALDTFNIKLPDSFTEVSKIEIWTEPCSIELTSSNWYIDTIKFVRRFKGESVMFPVFRWIKPKHHYYIYPWDTFLPQNDPDEKQREGEIDYKREIYQIKYAEGAPILCESLPIDEEFSAKYMWNMLTNKLDVILRGIYTRIITDSWKTLDDLTNVYQEEKLTEPESVKFWREDTWFGYQRLNGCNPTVITLCEEIPSKLGVDDEVLKPVLKGETLEDLIKKKRLFYTDLDILEGITHREDLDMCVPIALFMLNSKDDLVPIAIQLQQQKGPDNPIFLPTDDHYVWTLAKMWYNLADSSFHQSLVHLGLTHLLMEGVILAMHRNISVSHPLYKLLAPHTLFLLAINSRGFKKLVSPGGWVDKTMTIGIDGMFQLIYKGVQLWDFSIDGNLPKEFARRKVDDPNVLPKYYFRDDSLTLYNCILKYVSSYIDVYYGADKDVVEDWELQNWAECISKEPKPEDGGIGIKGLPMKDGKGHMPSKEQLKLFITTVLFTCSVSHAHANFLQYEEYAFPANYPSMIRTPLLKDKNPRKEEDLMAALPDKATTLDVMAITNLLSAKTTKSLGDFETQYIYDPKALVCVKEFQMNLKAISDKIRKRNKTLEKAYNVLDPVNIPNAISI